MRPSLSNAVSFIEEGDLESLAAALAEVPALMAQQEESGDTLLHHACQQKFDAAVALLLEAGASAHARGFFGRTPLHCAVLDTDASRAAPVVSRLLAAGADPRMKDEAGFDVIALARKEVWAPQAEVLDLFGARSSAQPNTATFEATRAVVEGIERRSHTELAVSRVLEAWASGAAVAEDGLTPSADAQLLAELKQLLEAVDATRWRKPLAELIVRSARPAQLRELLSVLDD